MSQNNISLLRVYNYYSLLGQSLTYGQHNLKDTLGTFVIGTHLLLGHICYWDTFAIGTHLLWDTFANEDTFANWDTFVNQDAFVQDT